MLLTVHTANQPLLWACPSFSDEGGVKSPAPPGNESDVGAVKALACCAFAGWDMIAGCWVWLSMTAVCGGEVVCCLMTEVDSLRKHGPLGCLLCRVWTVDEID